MQDLNGSRQIGWRSAPTSGAGPRRFAVVLVVAVALAASACSSDGGNGGGGGSQVGVVVNEVVAKALADASFNPTGSDWIELYNDGDAEVDLEGARLIDSKSKGFAEATALPPGTKIPAKGYLVVFFNHDGAGTPVIDKGLGAKEAVTLFDRDGVTLDQVDWKDGDAPEGKSWGRSPDGAAVFRTFDKPTPNAKNPS
jgi:hypothetical protein